MGTPTYTLSCGFECQFTGDNYNVWGVHLNATITKIDYSIAGQATVALTSSRALTVSNTSANNADNEARAAVLRFSGAGGFTATLPSVPKPYLVRNDATGAITLTTGAGTSVIVDPNDVVQVYCDGTNVFELGYAGQSLKQWISGIAWSYNAGNLPAMPGNGGKFVKTDGSTGFWAIVQSTDIGDWAARQAETRKYAMDSAIAMALVF